MTDEEEVEREGEGEEENAAEEEAAALCGWTDTEKVRRLYVKSVAAVAAVAEMAAAMKVPTDTAPAKGVGISTAITTETSPKLSA